MVKKLFRHELQAYWRVLLPVWGLLMGISVLGRLIQLFENDTVGYGIVRTSAITFYVVAVAVSLLFPFVFAIMRYYRNLFTGEGYLSFTLPVTPFQHILVKVTAALTVQLLTIAVCAVSLVLITFGDVFAELMKAVGYLIPYIYHQVGWGMNLPFFALEGLVLVVVAYVSETLLYYACISIGQTSKKNRVLAAVGVYFGYYFVRQVLGTIAIIIGTIVVWEPLFDWVRAHEFQATHIALCGLTVFYALLSVAYFAISHTFIRKRLNLE